MIYRLDYLDENAVNPITGVKYDDTWIICILNNEPYRMKVGSTDGCAYTLRVSRNCDYWKMAIGDFCGYNESINKNIILVISENDYQNALETYRGHTWNEPFLREYEETVLIHSTTQESYQNILRDDCLKSWNLLHNEGVIKETTPIGSQLGDPKELRDYILFGSGTTGEIVVNSRQCNRIVMDEKIRYKTSARMYFDMKKIAEDGLLIRDGSEIKVRDRLPIFPYLIWTATWEKIGLKSEVSTPREFAQKADHFFKSNILTTYDYEKFYESRHQFK